MAKDFFLILDLETSKRNVFSFVQNQADKHSKGFWTLFYGQV